MSTNYLNKYLRRVIDKYLRRVQIKEKDNKNTACKLPKIELLHQYFSKILPKY